MKFSYSQMRTLNHALHNAIEWNFSLMDSYNIEVYRAEDGQMKNRVPRCFKKDVRALESENKKFQKLREKVRAEIREIQQNKLELRREFIKGRWQARSRKL